MQEIVREAMRAGAVGFASSTSPAHNGEGGLPMPSRLADDREMQALVTAMGEGGRGVYMLTKGGHTPMPFLESLAARQRPPGDGGGAAPQHANPQAVFDDLDAITAANARGHRLLGQVSCCPLTMDFTMQSPYPVEGLASWQPALGLSGRRAEGDARRAGLSRRRARRAGDADQLSPLQRRVGQGAGRRGGDPGERALRAALHRRHRRASEGRDPLDVMLDLALAENLQTVFTAQLLNSDEAAVGRMLNHPHSIVSLSDAGAHLTFFNDAGFGLHLLGHWSRDLGAMSLREAVRRLTVQPASVFGLRERGLIREGFAADLLLFDPQTVGRGPKRRVYDLPGGRGAPDHRRDRRPRRLGQRPPGRRRRRLLATHRSPASC